MVQDIYNQRFKIINWNYPSLNTEKGPLTDILRDWWSDSVKLLFGYQSEKVWLCLPKTIMNCTSIS